MLAGFLLVFAWGIAQQWAVYHSGFLDLVLASSTFLRTTDFFSASDISFSARFRNSSQVSIESNSVR